MRVNIRPLTLDETKEYIKGDTFTGLLTFKLDDLIKSYGYEGFSEACEKRLFAFNNGFLKNFKCKIVGHKPPRFNSDEEHEVIIEISGELHVLES